MTVTTDATVTLDAVAETLRRLALDEDLKERVCADPRLRGPAYRVARRYIAGETIDDALRAVAAINERGDRATVDYMGESCRDEARAVAETDVFLQLSERLAAEGRRSSVSLDLSHIGMVVDEELGYRQAVRVAEATAAHGQELMLSMEGVDRTDTVLRVHRRLCERFEHVGVTVQSRLHRTDRDLSRLLELPGRVRLVKGAYPAAVEVAHARGSRALTQAYLTHAQMLLDAGHSCSIATHDPELLDAIESLARRVPEGGDYEFETLLGLGEQHLRRLRERGHPTREYLHFGEEWWLYTCNRIAEDPQRLFQALLDAAVNEGSADRRLGI